MTLRAFFWGDVQKAAKNFTFYAKKEERLGRGSVRKRRRAGAPFARLHRQTASTTTKGAGVFPPCGKMGARSGPQPAGRSAKRSGRIVVAPAAPSAFFLASASKGTPSRCKQLRPEILRKRTKKRSCKQFACRTAFCVSCVKISGLHRRFLMSPRPGLSSFVHSCKKPTFLYTLRRVRSAMAVACCAPWVSTPSR